MRVFPGVFLMGAFMLVMLAAAECPAFAAKAANMVLDIYQRHGAAARRFIVGNEPNHPAEGELEVEEYVDCDLQVYQAIKAAWPQAVVMSASVAPIGRGGTP